MNITNKNNGLNDIKAYKMGIFIKISTGKYNKTMTKKTINEPFVNQKMSKYLDHN